MKRLEKREESYCELTQRYNEIVTKLENSENKETAKNRQIDHFLFDHSKLGALGEMMTSIGHQCQQPLNSLSLLIQDVREALQFGEINHQYIETFTKESMIQIKQMSRTIHDFQKFYQPNKEHCHFSVSDSIEDALSIFSFSLKSQDIHVNFEYREQHLAYGFPNEFRHTVLNILIHSRDAFIKNDVKKRNLNIKIDSEGSFLVIDFINNAGGIETDLFTTKIMNEDMNSRIRAVNTRDGVRFTLMVPKNVSENNSLLVTI
jgi:C4-dicarboxylate-specific signal transduction histidine kinase